MVTTKNSIPELLATADAARHRAVSEATTKIVEQSQSTVAVDTGKLKGSVNEKIVDSSESTIGTVSYNTDYAIYVELGTSRMAAQPYLHPAYLVGSRLMVKSLVTWLRAA
jgi:HK97 gp10 family phage protein